jgi:hypothetical protein
MRSEVLRQAMMAALDGNDFSEDSGKYVLTFTPAVLGAYAIIGDGG